MREGISKGLQPLDALHVACALELDCEIFFTVDKGILKKASLFSGIRIISPVDFVMEREGDHVG
jgi:predicted nucleic acid-binding protein